MKSYRKAFKIYHHDPNYENALDFLYEATNEYIQLKTGRHLHLWDVGLNSSKDWAKWMYNDWKFKEWFKQEFGYWIILEDGDIILKDLRWIGVKKSYHHDTLHAPEQIPAKPRDVDDLKPEI